VDLLQIWGIVRLLTREELIRFWKWSGTYSASCLKKHPTFVLL